MKLPSTPFFQWKLIFVFSLFLLQSQFTHAQSYHHGVGLAVDVARIDQEFTNIAGQTISFQDIPSIGGLMYKATFGLSDHFAISFYPSIGYSTLRESDGVGFGFQVPANVEYYFGDMGSKSFFLGAGLTYSFMNPSDTDVNQIFGPQIGIGGQFPVNVKSNENILGFRLAFAQGLVSSQISPDMAFIKNSKSLFSMSLYALVNSK